MIYGDDLIRSIAILPYCLEKKTESFLEFFFINQFSILLTSIPSCCFYFLFLYFSFFFVDYVVLYLYFFVSVFIFFMLFLVSFDLCFFLFSYSIYLSSSQWGGLWPQPILSLCFLISDNRFLLFWWNDGMHMELPRFSYTLGLLLLVFFNLIKWIYFLSGIPYPPFYGTSRDKSHAIRHYHDLRFVYALIFSLHHLYFPFIIIQLLSQLSHTTPS